VVTGENPEAVKLGVPTLASVSEGERKRGSASEGESVRGAAPGNPNEGAEAQDRSHMEYDVEYTDTFGGEANYCWVRRATLKQDYINTAAIKRAAKASVGIPGLAGRWENWGELLCFRPYKMCTILFVTPHY
jgi:hypothetical protein